MSRNPVKVLLFVLALVPLMGQPVNAVPAFARREHVACQMCHFRPPELRVDGHEYVRRGFREEPPEPQEEGEEAPAAPAEVKRPLGVPLNIQWSNYLSVIGDHGFTAERNARPQLNGGEIAVWFAGPINRHWSGVAVPDFDIDEGESDIEHGNATYVTRWGQRFGSARFGHLKPFAILLNQGGPTMTLSTPVVLSTPADTGNTWTPANFVSGAELGAVGIPNWNLYFGGATPTLDEPQTSLPGFENAIDLYASADWFPGFLDSSFTAYGYWGHAWLSPTATDRPFHRAGEFFNIYGSATKATIGFLAGGDEAISGRTLDTSGGFVLVEQLLSDRWAAYARYDWFSQDLDAGGDRDISGPAVGASYWASTEVWLTAELQFLKDSGEGDTSTASGFVTWAL